MAVIDGRTGLEQLSRSVCLELLGECEVGRIGVVVDGAPEIYPVNFVVEDGHILFRTARGAKLRGIDKSPSVCFEVDGIDRDRRTGWSVLVKGRAEVISDAPTARQQAESRLRYWAPGQKVSWISIQPREITGRRILR